MKFLISLFILLTLPLSGGVVSSGLKHVSLHDKLRMKKFVEINFEWHQLSHVVYFNNKPMCFTTAYLRSPDKQPMDTFWIEGWKAFKKNEHLFPHPNFIFNVHIEDSEKDWKSISLFIINKRALIKCFNDHSHIFQQILGSQCTIDWFLSALESQKNIYELLRNDERLLGILLGYGKESAMAFYQAVNSCDGIPSHTNHYCPVESKTRSGCTLFPVVIMGNPDSLEVQNLISTYERELDEFWCIYRKQDALELFLKCICDEKDE